MAEVSGDLLPPFDFYLLYNTCFTIGHLKKWVQ